MLEMAVGTNWLGPNEGSPLKNQTLMSFNAATGVNFHAIKEAAFFRIAPPTKKTKVKKRNLFQHIQFSEPVETGKDRQKPSLG